MSNSPETDAQAQSKRTLYLTATVMTAAIAGFLFGYDGALMGSANLYLKTFFHLENDPSGFAFMCSSGAIGCIAGPFVGGWLCDKIGREKTIIGCALMLGIGAIMTAITSSLEIFNIFRIVGGFGIGLGSISAPMYIAEVAPPKLRGKFGTTFQLAVVVGSAAAGPAGLLAASMFSSSDPMVWRSMFASQEVVVILLIVFLFMLAPSPRWLAEQDRFDEAFDVLRKIHSHDLAVAELEEIKISVKEEVGGWGELFSPGIRFALLIGLLLAFFNNWTGWSAMGGYIPTLLELAGFGDSADPNNHKAAIMGFFCTYFVMSIMTVVSMFTIDKVGRRPLWITASIMMALITLATGFVFHFHLSGGVVLLLLTLCTIPHGIALGGLPWLMMSELYPNRVRAKGVAVTTTFLWIVIFSCGQFFPMLTAGSTNHFGSVGPVFWMFTFICILAALFGWKMMPETKGRTLEDIAASWKK